MRGHEHGIKELETRKAMMRDRLAKCGKQLHPSYETYRSAIRFFAQPCNLWNTGLIEDPRAVLKLFSADRLSSARRGFSSCPNLQPFPLLEALRMSESGMVPGPEARTEALSLILRTQP